MISDINGQIIATGICWRDGWKTMLLQVREPRCWNDGTNAGGANVPHPWRTFLFVLHKYMMLAFCKKYCDTAAGHRNCFVHT